MVRYTLRTAGLLLAAVALLGTARPALAQSPTTDAAAYNSDSAAEQQREKAWHDSSEHSMFLRGLGYYRGRTVTNKDYSKAANLWRRAAEMCDTSAQSSLGYMYYIGMGIPQSYEKAAKLYRMAAESGAADAQSSLALMYYRGQGLPKDNVQAMAWFIVSITNGNSAAIKDLRYIESSATPQQVAKAKALAGEIQGMDHSKGCQATGAADASAPQRVLLTSAR